MKKLLPLASLILLCASNSHAQTSYLDNYISNPTTLTTIGNNADGVLEPRDLDFKPNTNELWVLNNGDNGGGSFVIYYDAGLPSQSYEYRHDTHAGHFMIFPSCFAFGDNGEGANINEIQSTGGPTSTFMGPSLWLTDTNIFARVFQNNWLSGYPLGSHIDMLHQSPYGMGIAHDTLKAYWVMDGYNGNICKYDFVMDHGPGYEDHSAGKIWRYTDVPVTRLPGVPSHMILDKTSKWLYYIDGVSRELRRMNTTTGSVTGTLSAASTAPENLAGYWKVEGATVEVLDTIPGQPCGIDYYNGRLVVSDYNTGDIYLYSTSPFQLLTTISTGLYGMMGVKIGPDGHIWVVNNTENAVYRLDAGLPVVDLAITAITSPKVENFTPAFYSPNFDECTGSITPQIVITNKGVATVTTAMIQYTVDGFPPLPYFWNGSLATGATANVTLPSLSLANGGHLLSVKITSVNGSPDDVEQDNTLDGAFRTTAPAYPVPFTEGFASSTFPPAGWNYIHHNKHNKMSRSTAGGFGASVGSMKMDNWYREENVTGQIDYLLSPVVNMTAATANAYLRFSVAYARYNAGSNDGLQVQVSSDCGNTWTTVYNKSGNTLYTAPTTTSNFTPTSSQWRLDSVSMSAYAGQSEVLVSFNSVSGYGNNVYVDDIFIGDISTDVNELSSSAISIYPNPAKDVVNVVSENGFESGDVILTNVLGETVMKQSIAAGEKALSLNVSSLAKGYYVITLRSANSTFNKSIAKN